MGSKAVRFREVEEVGKGGARLKVYPHLGQMKVMESLARFVAMLGGSQSGKTSMAAYWLYSEIKKLGSGDYLAVTSNYDLFKLKMLRTWLVVALF